MPRRLLKILPFYFRFFPALFSMILLVWRCLTSPTFNLCCVVIVAIRDARAGSHTLAWLFISRFSWPSKGFSSVAVWSVNHVTFFLCTESTRETWSSRLFDLQSLFDCCILSIYPRFVLYLESLFSKGHVHKYLDHQKKKSWAFIDYFFVNDSFISGSIRSRRIG